MIGNLRHKLMRLTAQRMQDEGGGAEIIWQPAGEMWANVDFLRPLRDRSGDRRSFLKRIAAQVRVDQNLQEGQRLRFDGRDYEIVSIESDDDRQRRVVLIGEEIHAHSQGIRS